MSRSQKDVSLAVVLLLVTSIGCGVGRKSPGEIVLAAYMAGEAGRLSELQTYFPRGCDGRYHLRRFTMLYGGNEIPKVIGGKVDNEKIVGETATVTVRLKLSNGSEDGPVVRRLHMEGGSWKLECD